MLACLITWLQSAVSAAKNLAVSARLVAPPGTPAALAQRINRDTVEVLRSPEVAERLQSLSLEAGAMSPAETAKFFADETALWGKVIKEAGIEPQ